MTAQFPPLRREASASGIMRLKRLMDISVSTVGITILIPLFAIIAAAIRLEDGGPVFYRQPRVGRGGRLFEIEKFRSMRPARGGSHLTIKGDPRVTRVGAVLRRAKLDELPQLMNVFRGEMSLVGPRPETPDLMAHYAPAQRALMVSVRPGMTDYASVLLRDESALLADAPDSSAFYRQCLMPLKFELCARYLREIGPLTDLRILLATLWSVVLPTGRNPFLGRAVSTQLKTLLVAGNDDGA
jgi:lipopolysaccharide/colanic/teichoic acid biosynthesis glycosyltransferase